MSRILVIDDSELVRNLLVEYLTEQGGYEVQVAHDANEGYVTALKFRPSLILLDVQLPDVTGFELLRVLRNREELKDIPVIMITGTAHSVADKVKGFQSGADDYVMKPFEMPELMERIKSQLRKRSGPPQLEPQLNYRGTAPVSSGASPLPLASDPVAVVDEESAHRLHILDLTRRVLLAPGEIHPEVAVPGVSIVFLVGYLLLAGIALLACAGPAPKPAVVALSVVSVWLTLVSVLMMSGSILGLHFRWKDGARLVSMSAWPLLLKMVGGLAVTFWTTLSPFLFTAGPALVMQSPGGILTRIDFFELWSLVLLFYFLKRWPKSTLLKSLTIAGLVWFAALLIGLGFSRFGGTS